MQTAGVEFRSGFWSNLHHTLYAAAWAGRLARGDHGRVLAGALPAPLDASLTPDESRAWSAAVDYYDTTLASHHLLFGQGMRALNDAVATGRLDDPAVASGLRAVLNDVTPAYEIHYWRTHDAANRRWIQTTADRVQSLTPTLVPRLEELYGEPWPADPVPADIVWVGSREGAYTTSDPSHVTISSGDPDAQEWAAVETVFHEVSHLLTETLTRAIDQAAGDRTAAHPTLWHAVQFYLTGMAVRHELARTGIDYQPYLYATGLIDRVWSRYRAPVEDNWRPFLDGKTTRDAAAAATLAALTN
ncbi:MAG: hypothetical protein ACRDP8_08575 [Actinopolymorphaceae bacterium]